LENSSAQTNSAAWQIAVQVCPCPSTPNCHTKPPSPQAPGKKHMNKKANKKANMMDFD
jgi:hypothetical protein